MIGYRDAQPDDAAALATLGRDSFVEAFGSLYDPRDLAAFIAATYTPGQAAADIANPARAIRLAVRGDQMIGYAKLGFDPSLEYSPAPGERVVELRQLYLLSAHTGGGIGGALIDWAVDTATARGGNRLVLSVYSGNHAGQRFYARHGFIVVGPTYFWVGNQRDDELIMARSLG